MTICLNTQTLNTHQPSHKQLSQPVTTHITAHESYDYVQFTNLVWTMTYKLNSRFLEPMHIIYIRALCTVHHKIQPNQVDRVAHWVMWYWCRLLLSGTEIKHGFEGVASQFMLDVHK